MQQATQDENSIRIDTPLGKDALILTRFVYREALSHLFIVKAEVYSNGRDIKADALIGKEVTITLELGDKTQRYFHAVVADVTALGEREAKAAADAIAAEKAKRDAEEVEIRAKRIMYANCID